MSARRADIVIQRTNATDLLQQDAAFRPATGATFHESRGAYSNYSLNMNKSAQILAASIHTAPGRDALRTVSDMLAGYLTEDRRA